MPRYERSKQSVSLEVTDNVVYDCQNGIVIKMPDVKLVVALDVGSTSSGYAYAFTSAPSNVKTSAFKHDRNSEEKVPTSILLNKDRKFVAYGHEAEEKYIQDGDHGNGSYVLFRHFKLDIHSHPKLGRTTQLKDVSGRYDVPALELMALSLRFLKNHMIRSMNVAMETYCEDDCHFLVMVPGYWTDRNRAFMKTAALQAGITEARLSLVLECEAASLWQLSTSQQSGSAGNAAGSKFMTIDLGGGTADIIVHEKRGDGCVTSLHYPSGGLWGGSSVDDCFLSYLYLIFGLDAMTRFRGDYSGEFVRMMRCFESCRTGMNVDRLSIEIPQQLIDLVKETKGFANDSDLVKHVSSKNFGGNFEIRQTTLYISGDQLEGMFEYACKSLNTEISSLLTLNPAMKSTNHIVFCGGFAANPFVQTFLKNSLKAFSVVTVNGLRVTFPHESRCFSLKGAVLQGLQPTLIINRCVKLTYGIKAVEPYDKVRHKGGETETINGTLMCTNAFHVLQKGGTTVKVGHQVIETDKPLTADAGVQTIEVFSTGLTDDIPSVVAHDTMNKEFEFTVPLPFGCNVDDKKFDRIVTFGETELTVKVVFYKGKVEPCEHRYSI